MYVVNGCFMDNIVMLKNGKLVEIFDVIDSIF